MTIKTKTFTKWAKFMQFLFFSALSFTCIGQQYHDLGGTEITCAGLNFNQNSQQLEVSAFSVDLNGNYTDSAISYHSLTFDKALNLDSNKKVNPEKIPGYRSGGFQDIEGLEDHTFCTYFNPSKLGGIFFYYPVKIKYCELTGGSVSSCISILPDSAYLNPDRERFEFSLPNNDTIYTLIEYTLGAKDSIAKQYIIKLDTITGQVIRKEIKLMNQGENILLSSDALQLSNGVLSFAGIQYTTTQWFGVVVELDLSFNNLLKVRTRYGSYKPRGMWQKNNKLILFGRQARYDPNILTNFVYESIIEVIDLNKDTIGEQYFFPSNPKSLFNVGLEFAGPGAYFNGDYFVLAETVNQDSGLSRNYKTTLFAVDTNFKVICSKTITNSNKRYFGRVTSIIPDPDTPHTYIYCGYADNFPLTNSEDIMLGRFKVNANGIDMPEVNFRKAEVYFYPNPSSTHVNVLIDSEKEESYQLEFYNQKGQKVLEAKADGRKTRINHNLSAGVYTVVATAGAKREVLNLVVE